MQSLFFATHEDRVMLARRRYFEEGELPSGVVSDAVFQSWSRCLRSRQNPAHEVEYQPVSRSRVQLAMQRNHLLVASWQDEAEAIEAALGATHCAAMLTDPSGVIVGAVCAGRQHERIIPDATRLGVNLSEEAVGTTAPGLVARTGHSVSVCGAEHFFENVRAMYCAAAPIHDVHGRLAGVLDISTEGASFNFDATAVVGVFAATIENRLLTSQSGEHIVVCIQVSPSLLNTPMVGLLGFDFSGQLLWGNAAAGRLLGFDARGQAVGQAAMQAEELLGAGLTVLLGAGDDTFAFSLPSGLRVYARVSLPRGTTGCGTPVDFSSAQPTAIENVHIAGGAEPVSPVFANESPAAALHSFRAANGELIRRALETHGGNVSAVARALSVSRGLVYRYLKEQQSSDDKKKRPARCVNTRWTGRGT